MSPQITLIAVILLLLGAALCYFFGIRSVQISRRQANFRVRRDFLTRGRASFGITAVLLILSIALTVAGRNSARTQAPPASSTAPLASPVVSTPLATLGGPAPLSPAASATPAVSSTPIPASPTFFAFTSTSAASPTPAVLASAPALPISIEAIFQSSITPAADIKIGALRFSTEMNGNQPVGPGFVFRNPIKKMHAVFSYEQMAPGTQWTAVWYRDGELKYFETRVWEGSPSGVSFTRWEQPPVDWLPGKYEVHIYVGTQWKISGAFTLVGEPPTRTAVPSITPTRQPTGTPNPTSTLLPTLTPSATRTRTPTATRTASQTPTRTPTPGPAVQALKSESSTSTTTLTSTFQPAATATWTLTGTASPAPTNTATSTSTRSATNTLTSTVTSSSTSKPTFTSTPQNTVVKVYFTNSRRLADRTLPYEEAVTRQIPSSANPVASVLDEYFTGPNAGEQARGLTAVWNGFIGYRRVEFSDGTLNVYLIGYCQSSGGAYNIAAPLTLTLKQFPGIEYVKLYDEYERTRDPLGKTDSAPDCIAVTFTPVPTLTSTPTRTPTPTSTPTHTATFTPLPTATLEPTFTPTNTTTPTFTPLPTLTPTATASPTPSMTPSATLTSTPVLVEVTVYFTDLNRLRNGTPPYDVPVTRQIPSWDNPVKAVLDEYFRGPSAQEQARGLTAIWNGFVGYRRAEFADGSFRVYLAGRCQLDATSYDLSTPLTLTLKQFPSFKYIKIYDENDRTRDALGQTDSAPLCITATATPTLTATSTPSRTPTASLTPSPTATSTETPTFTVTPSPTDTSTLTPLPSSTATSTASLTPTPVPTNTATRTPLPTSTVRPSLTPSLTLTPRPSRTPVHTRTPLPTLTASPTATALSTRTPLPTSTARPSSSPTLTSTPRPTNTTIPTRTISPTSTLRPTLIPAATATHSAIPSATFTRTPRPSNTPQFTATITATAIPTNTAPPTATSTPPPTSTFTATLPPTATSTSTLPPTTTFTATLPPSATFTSTDTASPTPSFTATRTLVPSATNTASATVTASAVPTRTLTPTHTLVPTRTLTPTRTPRPSRTPTPTRTATKTRTPSPTFTATTDPNCYRAEFIGDVSIPDNTLMTVSAAFTKTWRLRNTGTCIWTNSYHMVFVRGDVLSAPNFPALPASVAPGQEIDLSLNLRAPAEPGTYQGFWMLQAPSGQRFGLGPAGSQPFWVRIRVTNVEPAASPTSTPVASGESAFDFIGSVCSAQWSGPNGALPCSGESGTGGSVNALSRGQMEDGTLSSMPALRLQPGTADTPVQGIYPAYYVLPGDHFLATIGCEQGAAACSVLYEVAYRDESGAEHLLWSFGEFQDGHTFNPDLDLTPLAGQKVNFILRISPLGSPLDDRALWVGPRIVHTSVIVDTPVPVSTLVPATMSPVPTIAPTLTSVPPAASPTPAPAPQPNPPSVLRQILDAIFAFLQRLFGG